MQNTKPVETNKPQSGKTIDTAADAKQNKNEKNPPQDSSQTHMKNGTDKSGDKTIRKGQ